MSEPIKMEPISLPLDPWIVVREGREQAWGIVVDLWNATPLVLRIGIICLVTLKGLTAARRCNGVGVWRAWRRAGWFGSEF